MRRSRSSLLGLLLAAALGCGRGSYDLELSFADGVDPSSVRYIELLVLPSCPEESSVAIGEPPLEQASARLGLSQSESAALPSLEALPNGRYGFYARGFDQTCHAIVSTCVSVRVTDDRGTVRLSLAPTSTATLACGASAICTDGRCEATDGAIDADACASNPCAADQYCTDLPAPAADDASGRRCTAVSTCPTGRYQLVAPTATSDRVCADCAAVCGGGSYEAVACADGNGTANRSCLPITACGTGQYQLAAPTATSDRVCGTCTTCSGTQFETAPCADGNGPQARTCQLISQCTTGQFQSLPPTPTSDRVCGTCDVCDATEYQTAACANGNGTQDRVCTPLTDCTTGQFQSVAPTATTNRVCQACHVCDADQYVAVECANGNGTQDRTCGGGSAVCTLIASSDGATTGGNGDPTMATANTGVQAFYAFVEFNLRGTCAEGGTIPLGSTITDAAITLTMATQCVCSGDAHEIRLVEDDWNESSSLGNFWPSVDSGATATFTAPSTNGTVTISNSTLTQQMQTFFAFPLLNHGHRLGQTSLVGNTASPWRWATREATNAAHRPRLVVTYTRP